MTLRQKFKERYLATPAFYKLLLAILIPLVVRQGITNFVSLLDNIMVGRLGTLQMSAVSIDNQLIFIFNLAIFGGLSGASIFSTQYYGMGDIKSMREAFRFKLYFSVLTTAIAVGVFLLFCEPLVMLFLKSEKNSAADIAATLGYAKDYMKVAVIGLLPFAIVQAYGGTLAEMGETKLPMEGGFVAIGINLVFNYLLIYGKFGFPALGVQGAAIATAMSRFAELAYVVIKTHKKSDVYGFAKNLFASFRVPLRLVRRIVVTGSPLMINEILWSVGQTAINKNYALRGIDIIAATNITTTAWNLFCIIMFAFGTAVSVIVGQKLGAEDRKGAMDVVPKLMFATVVSQCGVAVLLLAASPFIPLLYNVTPEVRSLATQFLMICGIVLPAHAVVHNIYFTIRSGGKTFITFLFDSFFVWVCPVVVSFILCKYTEMSIVWIYAIIMASDIVKLSFGIPMLRSGFWANTLVGSRDHSKEKRK